MESLDQMMSSFRERAATFYSQSEELTQKYNRLSIVRTIFFLISVITLIYCANVRNYTGVGVVVLVFPFLFALLLRFHNKIAYKRRHAQFLGSINEAEALRLEGKLHGFDSGERFLIEGHPYALDLDVFGKNSLFQLLNRCTTESAKRLLAAWLNKAASTKTIKRRQEAVQELAPMLDWRQDFQAGGMHYEDKESTIHTLLSWLQAPLYFREKKGYQVAAYLMPLVTVALIIGYFLGALHYIFPLLALAINAWIMRKAVPMATETQQQTYESIKSLKAYEAMIGKIEAYTFKTEQLADLKKRFAHKDFSARKATKKLGKILDWLNSRSNAFYFILNVVFLFDIHLLLAAERWKARTKSEAVHWFEAISVMEALVSLAGYAQANPEYAFPEIAPTNYFYQAHALGHPLLKKPSRVNNDFGFEGKGRVIVLTGSNMSGKSTFQRTLGTNAVLAFMGAPVCAQSLALGHFQIFTSMRTIDSLEESVSSFYAELRRLKQLLDTINDTTPVFFMLDEILKGTNSHDRHKGATALVRQLSQKNAFGLVSTHDLELGTLAQETEKVINYSFTSTIEKNEIIFDYKLHPGICQSFNATELMQKMGIEIENEAG